MVIIFKDLVFFKLWIGPGGAYCQWRSWKCQGKATQETGEAFRLECSAGFFPLREKKCRFPPLGYSFPSLRKLRNFESEEDHDII